MKGALAHEWIERSGGSERVLDAMAAEFEGSTIFALWDDAPGRFPHSDVVESWLARTPLRRHKELALATMPQTWRHLSDRQTHEWLLVSSHLFAHHARLRQAARYTKLVYVHTPARYIWVPELDQRGAGPVARVASAILRPWDRVRAREAKSIAANSMFIRQRVRDSWRRDADVIYPPVDTAYIQSRRDWVSTLSPEEATTMERLPSDFILGASRFVSYKQLDLVILAAEEAGLPAVIAGAGPEEARLRSLADRSSHEVHFVLAPSDNMLYSLFQRATVFLFPAVEDFGIMPVEAMATGCPVVVGPRGGAQESVIDGLSGVVAHSVTPESLATAASEARVLDRGPIADSATRFAVARFRSEIRDWVQQNVGDDDESDNDSPAAEDSRTTK